MRLGNAADITAQAELATSQHPCVLYVAGLPPGALCVLHPEGRDSLLSVVRTVFAQARTGCPHIVVALPGLSRAFRRPQNRWAALQWAWFLLNAPLIPVLACARHFLAARLSLIILQQPQRARLARRLGFDVFPSFAHLALAYTTPPLAGAEGNGYGAPHAGAERQVQHLPL